MKKNVFHQIIWYIIIFSLIGLLIEFLFSFLSTETRKGLILGPLCPIYGICATIIIFALDKFKGHKVKLFICGGVLGTFIQFLLSFSLEAVYGLRFWNYTNPLNLNGRICLIYVILWGAISILLIDVIKKYIDKMINKLDGKKAEIIDIILTIIIILEILFTAWGIYVYKSRAKDVYNDVTIFEEKNMIEKFGDRIFTDEIMVKIFPNLRFLDSEKNEVWIRTLIK